jgi:hypothetical protein
MQRVISSSMKINNTILKYKIKFILIFANCVCVKKKCILGIFDNLHKIIKMHSCCTCSPSELTDKTLLNRQALQGKYDVTTAIFLYKLLFLTVYNSQTILVHWDYHCHFSAMVKYDVKIFRRATNDLTGRIVIFHAKFPPKRV